MKTNAKIFIRSVKHTDFTEHYLSYRPNLSEKISWIVNEISRKIPRQNHEIIKMDVLGSTHCFSEFMEKWEKVFKNFNCPISFVEGNNCGRKKRIAGIQIRSVSNLEVVTLKERGEPRARFFEDRFAKYFFWGNMLPDDLKSSCGNQTKQMILNMEKILEKVGMNLTHVARTWFYNDRILDWYDTFNEVRNKIYSQKNLFKGILPASTGIGGKNPFGASLLTNGIAILPKNENFKVSSALSPLQCPAKDYGSAFNRAIEIKAPDFRSVLISGTASIEPEGKTKHVGDAKKQIAYTLKVVEAILKHKQMGFQDVIRAIAYVKHAKDAPLLYKCLAEYHLKDFPVILAQDDVCRDNLLFEIEMDALVSR